MNSSHEVVIVEVDQLQKHPRQDEFFSVPTEVELDGFAADLKKRGQLEPIHCTADYTIIRGHYRVECAKRLGWKTIKAVVHNDITDALDPEVINDLVLDNAMRRQLDDFELARCYLELKQSYFTSAEEGEGDVRDRLAARLKTKKAGRTLDRLVSLLRLPRGIQDAISRGELKQSHGEKILRLPADAQETIERRIAAGEPPRKIVQEFVQKQTSTTRAPASVGRDTLKFLRANLDSLAQNADQLDLLEVRGCETATLLDQAARFFSQWRDRVRALQNQSARPLSSYSAEFPQVGFRAPAKLAGGENDDGK